MNLTIFKLLEWSSYLIVLVLAIVVSWKKGEKEGSVFMLEYLRENKFMNDTDYNKFMRHVRTEKKALDTDGLSPTELKKNEKEKKDISNNGE